MLVLRAVRRRVLHDVPHRDNGVHVVEAGDRLPGVRQPRIVRHGDRVLGEVARAERLVVGDEEVALDAAEVAERRRHARHDLLLHAGRELPVPRPHAPSVHDRRRIHRRGIGAAEVRRQPRTAFAVGHAAGQVAVRHEVATPGIAHRVEAVIPGAVGLRRQRRRRVVRQRVPDGILFDAAARARLECSLAVAEQVVRCRHAWVDVLPVRHVLDGSEADVAVRQPAVRARRERLGRLVLHVDADSGAHREAVHRPTILRVDAEVVVEVVLVSGDR